MHTMNTAEFANKILLTPKVPEAWFLPEVVEDLKSGTHVNNHGICCWKVDPKMFVSPLHTSHAQDDNNLSDTTRHVSYANLIEMSSSHFSQDTSDTQTPDDNKMPQHSSFLFNGLKPKQIACYVVVGPGGFFDVDCDGVWIRMLVSRGDIISLPEAYHHIFTPHTTDDENESAEHSCPKYFAGKAFSTSLVKIVLD